MTRLVVVLMAIVAMLDAIPVATVVGAREIPMQQSCCCGRACKCCHCPVHRRVAASSAEELALDCAGCSGAHHAPANISMNRPFVMATTLSLTSALEPAPIVGADARRPLPAALRVLDPPPRPAGGPALVSIS